MGIRVTFSFAEQAGYVISFRTGAKLTLAETLGDKRIIAFYGYKGGAGRSLLAANVSVALSLVGKRVLLIDWDLEAPGVGDYFHSAVGSIPQLWRTHRGLFELLVLCRQKSEGSDLFPTIMDFLSATDTLKPLLTIQFKDFQPKGSLDFIGPGRQVGPEFAAALMTSDWADFFLLHAENFRKAFRKAMCDEKFGYDAVIIDTRTGYNLSTIFILRLMADVVYFVAPKTIQSLLGISHVWNLIPEILHSPNSEIGLGIPCPARHLIISRYRSLEHIESADSSGILDAGINYIKTFFGEQEPTAAFPALDSITDYEQLFIQDRNLRRVFFPRKALPSSEDADPGIVAYRDAFWGVCQDIGGIDLSTFEWECVMAPGLLNEEYIALRTELTPTPPPLLKQGVELADRYLGTSQDAANLTSLQDWADRAAILDRATLGQVILTKYKTSLLGLGNFEQLRTLIDLPPGLKAQLFLDDPADQIETIQGDRWDIGYDDDLALDESVASRVPARLPSTAGEENQTTTIVVPGGQPEARRRATRLWIAANTAKEQDNPLMAIKQLKAAIKLLKEAVFDFKANEFRQDVANDVAIFERNLSQFLIELDQWEEALRYLTYLLSAGDLPETRAIDDQRTVSKFDILWSLISTYEAYMRKTGRGLSARDKERISGAPVWLKNVARNETPVQQIRLDLVLENFAFADLANAPIKDELAIKSKLLKILELQKEFALIIESAGERGYQLPNIIDLISSLSLVGMLFIDHTIIGQIDVAAKEALLIVDKWFSGVGNVPKTASEETLALAAALRNVPDRQLEAFSLAQDTLQLLGNVTDGRSERYRIEALMLIGLLESELGRPDRAIRTWLEVDRLASGAGFPEGSIRARRTKQLKWWIAATDSACGQYEKAWKELSAQEQTFSKIVESSEASAAEKSDAWACLNGISGFLADVALNLGRFDEAMAHCERWERSLRKVYYFECDAARRLACCNLIYAESAFCKGQTEVALSGVRDGLKINQNSSEIFGGAFSFLQQKLKLFENEITSFHHGLNEESPNTAALACLDARYLEMLELVGDQGWHITDLISIFTAFARAAATALRVGNREQAEYLAKEVLQRSMIVTLRFEQQESASWIAELIRCPITIANSILSKIQGQSKLTEYETAAIDGIRQLAPGLRRRYAHIFSFCDFVLDP